jgi:acyl carrier protein
MWQHGASYHLGLALRRPALPSLPNIELVISNFVFAELKQGCGPAIDANAKWIENGFIDSRELFGIISFIERSFGIAVGQDELLPLNFESLRCVVEFVRLKSDAQTATSVRGQR